MTVSNKQKTAPYGTWVSPVTPELITSDSLRLSEPRISGEAVLWLEGRPTESGRTVLVRCAANGDIADLTPPPFNVRTRAHEYGGGAFATQGDRIWFVNFSDQCIYQIDPDQPPRRLTAPSGQRFADLAADPVRRRLIAVCEDHAGDGEAQTTLVGIELKTGAVTTLHSGFDFYSTPRLSADGARLAWLTWQHPNMPWDETRLMVAECDAAGALVDTRLVAGGEDVSVFQPEWTADGALVYASDHSGWWNLYLTDADDTRALAPDDAEYAEPQWVFGMRSHAQPGDGFVLAASTTAGLWRLQRIDLTGAADPQLLDLGCTSIEFVHADSGRAVVLAGAADRPMSVLLVDPVSGTSKVLRSASRAVVEDAMISRPQALTFPSAGGETAHALYYPPQNGDFAGPVDEWPPLLVTCHGGPTSAASTGLNLRTQFWTSRGIGVLDVNYRGSSGYGRQYRDALKGQWGIADAEDAVHGARHMVSIGLADERRLLIRGGSAGGYTVLCALTFHDAFSAGASYYGVGDLEALMADTHKFESRYGDLLIGPLPEARDVYRARSPVHHADKLDRPVIFFQGLDDKVVPPNQTRMMADMLRKKRVPVAVLEFEGEGHGFRRADTIIAALEAELYFYARVLGFEPADELPALTIDNLAPTS